MTEAEIRAILEAVDNLRDAIIATKPLDESAKFDTAYETGYMLGATYHLKFLLERDLRQLAADRSP